MPAWLTLLALLAWPAAPSRHEIHLSHTRMVVEGTLVTCRVRVFHDDAEAVLRRFTGRPDLRIMDAAPQDSVFQRYYESTVAISSQGARLRARVVQSGPDPESNSDTPMWWYVVEYRAPRPVTALTIRYGLMFEQFENQRNVITVLSLPGGERQSLYFAAGDGRAQVVKF